MIPKAIEALRIPAAHFGTRPVACPTGVCIQDLRTELATTIIATTGAEEPARAIAPPYCLLRGREGWTGDVRWVRVRLAKPGDGEELE
eukprot:9741625-Prorocentrum_lima.AAC.1